VFINLYESNANNSLNYIIKNYLINQSKFKNKLTNHFGEKSSILMRLWRSQKHSAQYSNGIFAPFTHQLWMSEFFISSLN